MSGVEFGFAFPFSKTTSDVLTQEQQQPLSSFTPPRPPIFAQVFKKETKKIPTCYPGVTFTQNFATRGVDQWHASYCF